MEKCLIALCVITVIVQAVLTIINLIGTRKIVRDKVREIVKNRELDVPPLPYKMKSDITPAQEAELRAALSPD